MAGERDRPDVARRRSQWAKYQDRVDAGRLVFIDETWTRTNMAPLRGWAPRGSRLVAKVPHGHWKTMAFLAACCSMRAHLDKKPSGGAVIGVFLITLLTPAALEILLSVLNALADAVRVAERLPWHAVWNGG